MLHGATLVLVALMAGVRWRSRPQRAPMRAPGDFAPLEQPASDTHEAYCRGDSHTGRVCRLRNACIHNNTLFLHPAAVRINVPADGTLLDMTGVADHNVFYLRVLGTDAHSNITKDAVHIRAPAHVASRFFPLNAMHAIHDDALPIAGALLGGASAPRTALVLIDNYGPQPYDALYGALGAAGVAHHRTDTPVCLADATVGVDAALPWYQYGLMGAVQGPTRVPSAASVARARAIAHAIRANLTAKHGRRMNGHDAEACVAIVSRQKDRLMLNEDDLAAALGDATELPVCWVRLESTSIADAASTMARAPLAVGMHGSALALAVFMPRDALLLELFPLAVPPKDYTPYRTLAAALGLRYAAWANTDPARSTAHPEYEAARGGLGELQAREPERAAFISDSAHAVQPHACCTDAHWLHRIYQDTVVDVDAILALVSKGR